MQVFFLPRKAREHGKEIGREIKHRAKTLRRKVFLSGSHKATETQSFFSKTLRLSGLARFIFSGDDGGGKPRAQPNQDPRANRMPFFYHGRRGNTERRLGERIKHRAKTLRRKIFLSVSHKATETQRFFSKTLRLSGLARFIF